MKTLFSVLISNFIFATVFANKVLAQDNFGINDLGDAGVNLGSRTIQETIGGIINVFLGFLGILATLLLLYGGYLWMTSRGNSDRIERAKMLIASALIGLVIIVSAYALARFILGRLYEEAGPTGPGNQGGPGPGGLPGCTEPADPNEPIVCSISNIQGPVGSGLTLRGYHFDTDGENDPDLGRVEINGVVAEIVECAGAPMWDDRKVKVKIPDSLAPGNYEVILYNDIDNVSIENPHFDFTVTPGVSAVNIDCLVPSEAPAPGLPVNVQVLGDGFTDVEDTISMLGWDDVNQTEITLNNADLNITNWSDLEIDISVPANALASNVTVSVGANSDAEFFDVTCQADGECLSGCCDSNSCMPADACSGVNVSGDQPVIQSISPEDGEEGSLVTIFGYNFGDIAGEVTFENVVGDLPSALSGGVCIDVWTDEYIIMGVPVGANGVLNVVVTQALGAGGESSDPYPGFERNDTVRPGICNMPVNEGQFGDSVDIEGINFAATDEAYFDTVVSYDTNVTPPNNATAEVPNVVGNLGVTMQTNANVSSNAFPFSALSVVGGAPVITELSPDNGPVESYVTIMGANFGDNQGVVWFDVDNNPNNFNEVAGDFNFPAACGVDYWFDDHIIVKVPAGPWVLGNDYPVRIERNPDSVLSNDFDFNINNDPLGPQICLVSPDNGPVDSPITISGENFGNAPGEVVFYDGVTSNNFTNWSENQIFEALVPLGAQTGPMLVRVGAQDSNAVVFDVGACENNVQCGGQECCSSETGNYCAASCEPVLNACEYNWEVLTELDPFELYYNYSCASGLQSPTPWPDEHEGIGSDGFLAPQASLDAFVDANISALFTRDVEDGDLTTANVEVWQCSNGANFDPTTCTIQIFDDDGILDILNHNTNREGFTFNPANNLQPDTWYRVVLGTFEAAVGTDTWTPQASDEWHFRTRNSDIICEVSSVAVTPQRAQSNMYPDREKNFTASPVADNCNICGGEYDWSWSLDPNPAPIGNYVSFSGPDLNMDVNQGYTRLTGGSMSTELTTVPDHITLIAQNVDYAIDGQTEAVILAPILRVESYTPDCSDSCTNVAIWADFTTAVMGPFNLVGPDPDFAIYQCNDPECSAWNEANNYAINYQLTDIDGNGMFRRVELIYNGNLPQNQNYVVVIDGDITNIHGYPLGSDYRWDFGVGDVNCTINAAEILPDNYTAYSANPIQYRGYAIADAGICGAQPIKCANCDFDWTSSNGGVATIEAGGQGAQSVLATPGANNGDTTISLDLDGTAFGLGQATDDTLLTVDISNNNNPIELEVDDYDPKCGACTNSISGVQFNSELNAATVNSGSIYIIDMDTNLEHPVSAEPQIFGGDYVEIYNEDFDLGGRYQIIVEETVLNTDGDNIVGGWQSPEILIEEEGCLADAVWVDPVNATAGASDTLAYRAVTTYNAAACGPVPVDCITCTYSWNNNFLGNFNPFNSRTPDFTTLPDVDDGDSSPMTLDALENGNPLPMTEGRLTIDLSLDPGDPLNIIDWWPDCDGACDNSQVGVRFNVPIVEATLGGFSIEDLTDVQIINDGTYQLSGDDRVLVIGHTPLQLNHDYRVTILPGVENSDGNTLDNAHVYDFTIGLQDCQITEVDVLPETVTVGPQEGTSYLAQTISDNSPSCGPLPVYCENCSYGWADLSFPDVLGTFNNNSLSNPIFTTLDVPQVADDDTTQIEATVNDQGAIFTDTGDLEISITDPLIPEVSLINIFPPGNIPYCTNIVPYMEFDISNGNLDRNSVEVHAIFYESLSGNPVAFSLRYLELVPDVLTVLFQPNNLLDTTTEYFFGFDDFDQILAQGGTSVVDMAGLEIGAGLERGRSFDTGEDACVIHRAEIIPAQDRFTCIDNTGCSDDVNALAGNQHLYQSVLYDIQSNILSSAGVDYTWASDNDGIVSPESNNQEDILATAGDNGLAHLNLEAFLNIDPTNIASTNNSVEVAACQNPWPALNAYPWDDNTLPDMNFSTYYCTDGGLPTVADVPIPSRVNSPGTVREYITVINYDNMAGNFNNYLGSLAYYDSQDEPSWGSKLLAWFKGQKARGQGAGGVDIIAFRVMDNSEHLSVLDWYNKYAPNPQAGELTQVNGYEALQVGSSIYIAASNIEPNINDGPIIKNIYTNIYIIAHNIEANGTTLEIYNQLVDNFKLNINIATDLGGACNGQATLSCTSDFDCPSYCLGGVGSNEDECENVDPIGSWVGDTCNAPLIKLRKDTKRLGDLVSVKNELLEYGLNHMACANNSLISCNNNSDCPSHEACIPYYPVLNAGTYLNGSSNTSWPSWQQTLASTLGAGVLPEDPVNLFNGCSDPYNSETCWDEGAREFMCPTNSLVYMYNIEGVGQAYYLGANFEYDMQAPAPVVNFATDLFSPPPFISLSLAPYCNTLVLDAPGASASPYCGNGIIDNNYCTEPVYDNAGDCADNGGQWIAVEECDNEFWRFACSESPPSANPAIPTVPPAGAEWWREQTIGCNPPGTVDSFGNLIECKWYRPNPPLVHAQCGGYCGDGTLQPYYENCDGSLPANSDYHCAQSGVAPYCGDNCQVLCNNNGNIYAAALCGDGVWSSGAEQCDPTATPNGNSGWDCTEGGSISCSNTCQRVCSVGVPYSGLCGDGQLNSAIDPNTGEPYEACDYANYSAPLPVNSSPANSYGCTLMCQMNNTYCGDGTTQYANQELCDWNGDYDTPEPLFSSEFNQYNCRSTSTYTGLNGLTYGACTPTLDGWCGDGHIQDGVTAQNGIVYPNYGEACDPGSSWDGIAPYPLSPSTAESNSTNQYFCDIDCVGRIGGYCGDGKAQRTKICVDYPGYTCNFNTDCPTGTCEPIELCDLADYPGRPIPELSNPNNTYTCNDDCNGSVANTGGYCGDGRKDTAYYEACDWGPDNDQDEDKYPWPYGDNLSNFSSPVNQYVCSACTNFGGYCGNGIVDGACTVAQNNGTPVDCTDWFCQIGANINYSISSQSDCSNAGGTWIPTNSYGCSEYECDQRGGYFSPYEQCDSGYDPAYLVNKNIDIVYLFDMSGSLYQTASNLCLSLATVVTSLNENPTTQDVDWRITIFPLGDGSTDDGDGAEITSGEEDNIQYFFEEVRDDENFSLPTTDNAFDSLYTDCLATSQGLLVDTATGETIDPRIRYRSFYDDATNDIDGPVYEPYYGTINFDHYNALPDHWTVANAGTHNDDGHHFLGDGVSETCHIYDLSENWGYAMKRVIEDYAWLDGYHRIVVPVSDEYAVCGGGGGEYPNSSGLRDNEDFDDENGVYDVLVDAVDKALANKVFISPVLLNAGNFDIGQRMADATGGEFTNDTDDWGAKTLTVINSTICDGTGPEDLPDGHMDCVMDPNWSVIEPPPPPPPVVTAASYTIYVGSPFSHTIQATNSPQSYNASPLPAGLSVNTNTGVISGTPTAGPGSYQITMTATNAGGPGTATLNLTIEAIPIPVVSPGAVTILTGQPVNYQIISTNPLNEVLVYSVDPLTLPAGLSVNPNTGLISGIPTVGPGSYAITIRSTGSGGTGQNTLTLIINPQPPVINSPTTDIGIQSYSFSYLITATNSPTSFNATNLPPGLSVNTATGQIYGTPTVAGIYNNITISATNVSGTDSVGLSITISPCAAANQSCAATVCCSGLSCNSNVCTYVNQHQQQAR